MQTNDKHTALIARLMCAEAEGDVSWDAHNRQCWHESCNCRVPWFLKYSKSRTNGIPMTLRLEAKSKVFLSMLEGQDIRLAWLGINGERFAPCQLISLIFQTWKQMMPYPVGIDNGIPVVLKQLLFRTDDSWPVLKCKYFFEKGCKIDLLLDVSYATNESVWYDDSSS